MPVSELLDRVDAYEMTEWMAYERIDPFGNQRQDYHMAMICSSLYNVIQSFGKQRKTFTPDQFMPEFGGKQEKGEDELLAIVEQLNAAFGGEDLRNC